ncbi:MAG TPA: hypothetical protein VLZ74_01655 [Methylocella sp.]|nr:hypothetical protein [Methylocella sp.]
MTTAGDQAQATSAALAPEVDEKTALRLQAIRVRTEPGEVAAFFRETGGIGSGDFVPLTFPFRWLALPSIRGAILQVLGDGCLPVHEGQSFAYERGLKIDGEYVLAIEIRSTEKPQRLILKMTVSTDQGDVCARLETTLRIVRLAGEAQS